MDWSTLLNTFLGALFGALMAVLPFAFRLGGLFNDVKNILKTCDKRATDHCHHYNKISTHEVTLGQHETRILSLEQWRAHEEA